MSDKQHSTTTVQLPPLVMHLVKTAIAAAVVVDGGGRAVAAAVAAVVPALMPTACAAAVTVPQSNHLNHPRKQRHC